MYQNQCNFFKISRRVCPTTIALLLHPSTFPIDSSTFCKANFLNPGHHPPLEGFDAYLQAFHLPQIKSVEESSMKNIVDTVNHDGGC